MKKKVFWFFSCVIGIALVIVVLLIFAIASVISDAPAKKQMEPLNYTAWFSANKKANDELNFLSTHQEFSKERTISFSKDEINSLLYISVQTANTYSPKENQNYKLEYVNFNGDSFVVHLAVRLNFNSPFGNIVNLKIDCIPSIEDNYFDLNILSLKIGNIAIPKKLANYSVANIKKELKKNDAMIQLLDAVKLFKIKNNSIEIKYIPSEAAKLLAGGFSLSQ